MSNVQLRVIALCILINVLDGFDILAMAYAAPALAQDWGLENDVLGLLFSLGLGGMTLGSLVLAQLADRFGRRPVIISCLLLAAISMLAASLSQDVVQLGSSRFVTGLAIGAMLPCINTMTAEYAPKPIRASVIAIMQAGFATGATMGGFAAAWLLSAYGWHAIFGTGAALTVALLPFVVVLMPESLAYLNQHLEHAARRERLIAAMGVHAATLSEQADPLPAGENAPEPSLATVRIPLALLSIAYLTASLGFYFLTSWVPKLLVDSGMPEGTSVIAGALLTAGGIIAAFLLAYLSMRRPVLQVVATMAGLAALATVAFAWLPNTVFAVYPGALLLGTAIGGGMVGIYAVVPSLFPVAIRAGATGFAIGIGRAGAVIGPGIAGLLLAQGWQPTTVFALMALALALCAWALIRLRPWQLY